MNKITKISLFLGMLLFVSFGLKAQTTTYSGSFPITLQAYSQIYQSSATWMGTTSAPSSASRTACYTQTDANFNSSRNITYQLPRCGTITLKANNGTAGRGMIITVVDGSNNQLYREAFLIANSGCTDKEFVINNNGLTKITFLSPTSATANVGSITAFGSVYLSYINITDYVPPITNTPAITKFTVAGVDAVINQTDKTISKELPWGTNLTNLTPTVEIGGTATDYSPKGSQNFTNPVIYTATDGTTNVDYTVTLTASSVVPTPTITLTSGNANTAIKAGATLTNIVYTLNNVTGAQVTGLPNGVIANWNSTGTYSGTITISGTPEALTTYPGVNNFDVTATPISGYSGSAVKSSGSITVTDPTLKLIAYVINTAVDAKDTRIRPMLSGKYHVENIPIANITPSYVFTPYDMVILTEAPSSGSAGMKALWGINKPLLALKMYAIQANTWNLSTATNPSPAATGVAVNEPNHPIFNGVTFTGTYSNEIEMFDAISAGNGVQTTPYAGIYNLANVKGLATTGILELPVGTASPMTGTTNANLQQKLLFVSIANDNQNIVTDNALKVIDNAVNYLTGGTVWGTDAGTQYKDITVSYTGSGVEEIGQTTAKLKWNAVPGTVKYVITQSLPAGVNSAQRAKSAINIDVSGELTSYNLTGLASKTDYTYTVTAQNVAGVNSKPATINFSTLDTRVTLATLSGITFDGRTILNPNRQQLHVYNATGGLVATSVKDINMSAQAKGVYLVKGENGIMKIAVTK